MSVKFDTRRILLALDRKRWTDDALNQFKAVRPDVIPWLLKQLSSGTLSPTREASALVVLAAIASPTFFPDEQRQLVAIALQAAESHDPFVRGAAAHALLSRYRLRLQDSGVNPELIRTKLEKARSLGLSKALDSDIRRALFQP